VLKIEVQGKSQMKSRNTIKIFNYIRENGPVSRTDLSKTMRISLPSITRITNALINENFIREIGIEESNVGRKPIKLDINKDICYCIGINISKSQIHITLVNLGLEILYQNAHSLSAVKNADDFLFLIDRLLAEVFRLEYIPNIKILGIAVASVGIIDYENGVIVRWNPKVAIGKIEIKKYLERKYDLLVKVDSKINAILFGHYWYKSRLEDGSKSNFIYLHCGEGVGGSVIVNGQILRGYNNIAGKFGHMIVAENGRKCDCGCHGCLQAYASRAAIEENYYIPDRDDSNEKNDVETICQRANHGDQDSIKYLNDILEKISIALINAIVILNPEVVIVSGEIFDYYRNALEYLKGAVYQKNFAKDMNRVIWERKGREEFMTECYVTALIYEEVFSLM
jgi:N-acetylglucosamine repressor